MAAVPAEGITIEDKAEATRALLRCGATIEEVNAVRKHLSRIKGGRLGVAANAVKAVALVLCDVPSGDLAMVASGPTLPDPTTYADCLDIVCRHGAKMPDAVSAYLARGAAEHVAETPKPGEPLLAAIEHELLAGPADLASAAARALERTPARPRTAVARIAGDVAAAARSIEGAARGAPRPSVLVFCGEPTVRPGPGSGRGGRMQQLALLLARAFGGANVTVLAAGSDGRDGDTDHAGAIVDGATYAVAPQLIDRAIERYDSASACSQLGLAIPRWETGTNLADLVLVAVGMK